MFRVLVCRVVVGLVAGLIVMASTPAGAAQAACDGRVVASGGQSIDVGGAKRTFVVRPPSEGDQRSSAPVVFALHPFGMNAQYMQTRAPIGRAWPSAIVVYPDGMGRDGTMAPSWQGRPGDLGDRDLAFFDGMLKWLDERTCIDRARVFVLGYSNGAGLTYVLACERRTAVAGIAIAAGRLGCRPSAATPVIMSHGVGDRTIGYEQAIEASKVFAAVNGCAAPPKPGVRGCVQAQSCAAAPVSLCTHGGGHEYDVTFTRAAVEFFQSITPPSRAAGALPDWSGVWMMVGPTVFDTATQTGRGGVTTPGVRSHPPYNAEWEAVYRTHLDLRDKNRFPDTISTCGTPAGFPRLFNLPDAYEFIVRPEQVWVFTENGPNILRVYTDGRPHLADQWETYTGDSVGHWEGDTLVFTTRALKGFRDKDVILDRTGLVLSDKAHVTTRIRRSSPDLMDVRMTIEDSVSLTKPWAVAKQFRKQPAGTRVYDYGCAENNRNPVDATTGKTLILAPDGTPLNK